MTISRRQFSLAPMALLFALVLCLDSASAADPVKAKPTTQKLSQRPNFLIIVADDLGWSDIGVLGGEIETPRLDHLAASGTVMTQFYVAPVCSPTRAMLLTGVDSHAAGVGVLDGLQAPNQRASYRYAAQLHDGVVTVAEGLRAIGYQTYMAGKWHLAIDVDQRPDQRGFERSYALLQGAASHFSDRRSPIPGGGVDYLEDGSPVDLPSDFYSTIAFTDKMLEYLEQGRRDEPFFAYLAYSAPHDPLQVPDTWLDKYHGVYDAGPVAIREQRATRLKQRGLFPQEAELWTRPAFPPWLPLFRPEWSERTAQERLTDVRPMEIYASMIELMDQQIGRVIDYLQRSGELENTYVIFLSDNGANGTPPLVYPGNTRQRFLAHYDLSLQNMGRPGSYTFLGPEWASAAESPWKLDKGTVGEGGIRSPLIVAGPGVPTGRFTNNIAQVIDLTPTIYALAGAEGQTDEIYEGKIRPDGDSLVTLWHGGDNSYDKPVVTEFRGSRSVRRGRWKAHFILLPIGSGRWELFDMQNDPGEVHDVADEHIDIVEEFASVYAQYADRNGVIFPEPALKADLRVLYAGDCNWWCDLRFRITNAIGRFLIFIRTWQQEHR